MRKLVSYRGLTALVTGASSGIGERLARRVAQRGARLVLVARRADRLEKLADEICSRGGEAIALSCDVADRTAVFDCARQVLERVGPIDLLVNNAGYGHHRRFVEWDVEDMERMMRVNYLGAMYWTKALLPPMLDRQRGWIVFLASVAGKIGVPDESAYAASKFAMVGLAESLSFEVEDEGVHVLTVCPGSIRTDFFDQEALERMPAVAKRAMAEPEPLVDAIVDALARGKHEITFPRPIAAAYAVRAVLPRIMRWGVKRNTRRQD
jgi:hypothetical protein